MVGLQEVSPAVAQALRGGLSDRYPYQILGAPGAASSVAILSRYPLQPTGIALPGQWSDAPLVARLQFAGATVTVLDAHPVSTLLTRGQIRAETGQRAYTAEVIADFARAQQDPTIVLSDFNAGDQSTPYATVTRVLGDAWREGGVGFGHTFPGDRSFDESRPRVQDLVHPAVARAHRLRVPLAPVAHHRRPYRPVGRCVRPPPRARDARSGRPRVVARLPSSSLLVVPPRPTEVELHVRYIGVREGADLEGDQDQDPLFEETHWIRVFVHLVVNAQ